jgi:hypothetical protein
LKFQNFSLFQEIIFSDRFQAAFRAHAAFNRAIYGAVWRFRKNSGRFNVLFSSFGFFGLNYFIFNDVKYLCQYL